VGTALAHRNTYANNCHLSNRGECIPCDASEHDIYIPESDNQTSCTRCELHLWAPLSTRANNAIEYHVVSQFLTECNSYVVERHRTLFTLGLGNNILGDLKLWPAPFHFIDQTGRFAETFGIFFEAAEEESFWP